jgi:hypothetical protein
MAQITPLPNIAFSFVDVLFKLALDYRIGTNKHKSHFLVKCGEKTEDNSSRLGVQS